MAAAGMPDGEYQLGSLAVTVTDGPAYMTGTDTIAGDTPARALGLVIPQPAVVGRAFSGVLISETGLRVWREGREHAA